MSTLVTVPATVREAIIANMEMLHFRLMRARTAASGALFAMREEKQGLAIGILLDLEQLLPEIDALYRLVVMLHRSSRNTPNPEVQS